MIQEIQSIFQFSRSKFFHLVKKPQYQSIIQFLIPKQKNKTSVVVKTQFQYVCAVRTVLHVH